MKKILKRNLFFSKNSSYLLKDHRVNLSLSLYIYIYDFKMNRSRNDFKICEPIQFKVYTFLILDQQHIYIYYYFYKVLL